MCGLPICVEEAIEWADVLNVLRLQLERMQAGYIPSLREYYRVFGVTQERLAHAPRELLILHPGPMNRGVEIDSRVADGPHSVILNQVTNGVAVRMAVLYLLAGGRPGRGEGGKGGWSRRGSWTCTSTCSSPDARTPRRSPPARAPRWRAASPRSARCRTPTRCA